MINDKNDIKDFLVSEAEYDRIEVEEMNDFELFDAYLSWFGIIGWTGEIIDVINAVYGTNIDY